MEEGKRRSNGGRTERGISRVGNGFFMRGRCFGWYWREEMIETGQKLIENRDGSREGDCLE